MTNNFRLQMSVHKYLLSQHAITCY